MKNNFFRKNGYFVIKNLLNSNEVDNYRNQLLKINSLTTTWDSPDGITKNKGLWSLIVNKNLIKNLKNEVGDIKYTQHSDILVNTNGIGWHRDSAHRTFNVGPDWDEKTEKYSIVRVAIYLFDNKNKKPFSLGLIPNSHKKESFLTKYSILINNKFNALRKKYGLKQKLFNPPWLKIDWPEIESGDAVIFDQRVYHSPNLYAGHKVGLFLSFGLDNSHSINHVNYYRKNRKDLGYLQFFEKDLINILKENKLFLK
jgi:hypothetical protein